MINIQVLDAEKFAPYGMVIPMDNAENVPFDIKLREHSSDGWRIAILKVTNRASKQLHCHHDSLEVFEPVSGIAILVVATRENPDIVDAFLLDRPVCVNKGVWHSTIALSAKAIIKIIENALVTKETHDIFEVSPVLTGTNEKRR